MAEPLKHKGFTYWKRLSRPNKIYYTCALHRKSFCPARLVHTLKDNSYIVTNNHICSTLIEKTREIGEMEASDRDIKFKHPCTILLAGPTGSGKTILVRKILQDHTSLFDNIKTKTLKVTWCYGQWQPAYSTPVRNVEIDYVDELIDQTYLQKNRPQLVVIDDLMTELGGDKVLANLFTKGSHHLSVSVIFIVQNLFHQGPQMRNISLNSHYIILLKNPRDKSQIISLARQLYPTNMNYLQNVYKDATSKPFGYLLLDLTPDTPEGLRCRTQITSDEMPEHYRGKTSLCPIVYQEDEHDKGKFTKSYTIVESTSNQDGGRSESAQRVVDHSDTSLFTKSSQSHNDLRDCLYRLDVVARTRDPRRRKTLLRELSHDHRISEALRLLAQNTINMRIPLEKQHKIGLIKHREIIKQLAHGRGSKARRKQLVEQSGGFLSILLPVVLELVSSLIN